MHEDFMTVDITGDMPDMVLLDQLVETVNKYLDGFQSLSKARIGKCRPTVIYFDFFYSENIDFSRYDLTRGMICGYLLANGYRPI